MEWATIDSLVPECDGQRVRQGASQLEHLKCPLSPANASPEYLRFIILPLEWEPLFLYACPRQSRLQSCIMTQKDGYLTGKTGVNQDKPGLSGLRKNTPPPPPTGGHRAAPFGVRRSMFDVRCFGFQWAHLIFYNYRMA